jgi:hypothetical protein
MRLALLALLAACRVTGSYTCDQDSQCVRGAVAGRCETDHACSLPDSRCPSGYRYDPSAASQANQCVGAPPIDAAADAIPDAAAPVAAVNFGGSDYTGIDYPGMWKGDPTGAANNCNAAAHTTVMGDINGTVDDPLFLSNIFAATTLSCMIPNVPAGRYHVTMLFADIYCGCPNGIACTTKMVPAVAGLAFAEIDVETEGGGCAIAPGPGHVIQHGYDVTTTGIGIALSLAPVGSGDYPAIEALEVTALP